MFLRNYSHSAALAEEVTAAPLGRILLDEPRVLYRTCGDAVVALEDRCPHRGFPLHGGRLINDQLECGYHGFTFDATGRCVRIPGVGIGGQDGRGAGEGGAAATGSGAPEGNFDQSLGSHTFNAVTPETARSCHYFWALAERLPSPDPGFDDALFADICATVQEDLAVFEAQQRSLELKPDERMITLKSDAALITARRMVERLLAEESAPSKIRA